MNKYEKWYSNITKRGQESRNLAYSEDHHILPKSLGGNNEPENLTTLTAREHFIAHWLLTKIYFGKERYQLLNALQGMRRENQNQTRYHTKITARVYENLKEEWSKLSSERIKGDKNPMWGKSHNEEAKLKISQANKGRAQPELEKQKQIAAQKGKKRAPFSDEWLAKIKEARQGERNGMFGKQHSEDTKRKQSEKAKGRKQSAETIAKKAEAVRGSKREKILCPHCQQLIAVNVYPRWHGDNCKMKDSNENI